MKIQPDKDGKRENGGGEFCLINSPCKPIAGTPTSPRQARPKSRDRDEPGQPETEGKTNGNPRKTPERSISECQKAR